MIYLILKIFVYLAFALALGGAAGWLLRQFTAQQREEQLQRDLADARSKVPQLESMIRARDEKLRRANQGETDADAADESLKEALEQAQRELKERDQDIRKLKGEVAEAREAAASGLIAGDALFESEDSGATVSREEEDGETDALITALHQQIAELKEELAGQRIQLELQANDQSQQRENAELSERLRQRASDQQRLKGQLEQEQRRVLELERERELQAKSLRVLHQQLELARDSSMAAAER